MRRAWAMAVGAVVMTGAFFAAIPGGARAQEGKAAKIRRIVEKMGYVEQLRDTFAAQLLEAVEGDRSKADRFLEAVEWKSITDYFVEAYSELLDEETVATVLAYLESPEGKRYAALSRFERARAEVESVLEGMGDRGGGKRKRDRDFGRVMELAMARAKGTLPELFSGPTEAAAVATLRNLVSCQAQIQTSGKIDADQDGIGEYGTILELTGSVGVRRGHQRTGNARRSTAATFADKGSRVDPPILSPSLAVVDADGIVRKNGYYFRVFLPDASVRSDFVHETGPAEKVGLAGGTASIGVDLSEICWCAYAWPEERGKSGTRVFFTNQEGDVLESPNTTKRWEGTRNPPRPDAAFLGAGITSPVAAGRLGNDGDVWKIAE